MKAKCVREELTGWWSPLARNGRTGARRGAPVRLLPLLAVTHLRASAPIEVVRRQLGHSTPMLTLKIYGAFVPTGEDRAHWTQQCPGGDSNPDGPKARRF